MKYIRNITTGEVYPWNKWLMERGDFEEAPGPDASPKSTPAKTPAKKPAQTKRKRATAYDDPDMLPDLFGGAASDDDDEWGAGDSE